MDSNERAKNAADARKNRNKGSANRSSGNTSDFTSNGQSMSVPDITRSSFDKRDIGLNVSNNVAVDLTKGTIDVTVPGIDNIDVNSITSRLHGGEFIGITDIKNPNIPEDRQASKAELDRAIAQYERAINYEQIAQKANAYVGEQFKTLKSKIDAYKQGLISATAMEELKQQLLKFLKAQQVTNDTGIDYVGQLHKTATNQSGLVYTFADNESTLEKKRIKARKSFEEAKQEVEGFDTWLETLKGKTDSK